MSKQFGNKRGNLLLFFFFQAEDGIRVLGRSRGLGDVYKRRVWGGGPALVRRVGLGPRPGAPQAPAGTARCGVGAVSYTHLTLPTIYFV